LFTALILLTTLTSWAAPGPKPELDADIHTSMGHIIVRLEPDRAPQSVENFLQYVRDRAYDGTIFHRVIKDFMIQGGGYTRTLDKRPTRAPVVNEADNGLENLRGTIAMARTRMPDSATNQFFINSVDNPFLDHRDRTLNGWGYAVFGRVIEGMDVVDRISAVATGPGGPFGRDVPREAVVIEAIRIRNSTEVQQNPGPPTTDRRRATVSPL
jgi:cyclophilin family peptidyl-prolyl cis-trans isomerase